MADEGSALDRLVSRVPDEALRARIAREVELLRDSRRFGLVFDRHLPETVRLPGFPVRVGVTVGLRDESSDEQWTVIGVVGGTAELDDGSTKAVSELVVVREFGDPVLPGLRPVARHGQDETARPRHVVINGENLHALQMLRETHRAAVDLIYIDPPYNTGNDGWIYNDRYVDANDRAKSSKWLSFMERRLQVAYDLLAPTGIIIVAIGDDEHHRLRMLMDQVFGHANFIANIVWQGGGSFLARHHAGGVDYMLIYGKDARQVGAFRDPKPGAPEMLEVVDSVLATGAGIEEARAALQEFIRTNRSRLSSGLRGFNEVDAEGRVFDTADITNRLYRPNLRYPVTDPSTGQVVDPPDNGWAVERTVMDRYLDEGRLVFRGRFPRIKKYLQEYMTEMPVPTFVKSRSQSGAHLADILGEKRFPNPKDHTVLMRWIRMAAPKDALVLDFFGGSGSTTEAVMRLNAEDGGTRQSILVTNNEVGPKVAQQLRKAGHHPGDRAWSEAGVFEHVTRPRITTLVTGVRPDGSSYDDMVEASVDFFELVYLDPGRVRVGLEIADVAPVLWLESGATGRCIDRETDHGWDVSDTYAVLFDTAAFAALRGELEQRDGIRTVYVVSDSPAEARAIASRLPVGIDVVRLYDDFLRTYGGVES